MKKYHRIIGKCANCEREITEQEQNCEICYPPDEMSEEEIQIKILQDQLSRLYEKIPEDLKETIGNIVQIEIEIEKHCNI